MVQILDSNPSFSQQLGAQLGKAGGTIAQQLAEDVMLKNKGVDVSGLTGYARDVAIKEGIKRAALIGQGRRELSVQGGTPGTMQTPGIQPVEGNQSQPGTAPSPRQIQAPPQQQRGVSKDIIPPEQIEAVAAQRAHAKLNRGVPTDLQTERGLIQQENANVAQYKQYQEQLGNLAEEEFTKAYKSAKPEEVASFRRKGEELATQGLSEAQVKKQLAIEARKYANEVKNLRNIQGNRFYHKPGQIISGTSRSDEERRKSIRTAAKPFLDRGEYSVVRNELSKKGYGPEETEEIISNLSEQTKKSLNDFQNVPAPLKKVSTMKGGDVNDPSYRAFANNPEGQKKFGQNLQSTLEKDPNSNLLLLRKAYQDKGVDCNAFKSELDNMLESGQWQPNDEQSKMLEYIQEPPLNILESLLHEMNIIGR